MQHTESSVRTAAAHLTTLAREAPAPSTQAGPARHRIVRLLSDLAPSACTRADLPADDAAAIPALALTINALLELTAARPHELAHHLDTLTPAELRDLLARAREFLTR